jgi:methionyl-tRNA formyltransferase
MAEGSRVLLLGMLGAFSRAVCESALQAGVRLCGVMVPGYAPPSQPQRVRVRAPETLPILRLGAERTVVDVAHSHGITVLEVSDLTAKEAVAAFRKLQPQVMAVACWPRLIPRSVRDLVGLAVNVHPSLLPDNRGPAPVFWTVRLGYKRTGVTVHMLDDRADAGPILAQREVAIPAGLEAAELELQLAELGGKLLSEVVTDFARGRLHQRPQDESRATYHPPPGPEGGAA